MNIRSLSNPQAASAVEAKALKVKEAERIETKDTTERDADGQQSYGNPKRPVTEEELEQILKALKAHKGIVENNLRVEVGEENGVKVLRILDKENHLVRRVIEENFYELLSFISDSKPSLLNKAA